MLNLKKGDKVKVIDAQIFDEGINENNVGWVTDKELNSTGNTTIKFYPNKIVQKISNKTRLDDYLEKVDQ